MIVLNFPEVQSNARVTDRHKKTETSGPKIPQPVGKFLITTDI